MTFPEHTSSTLNKAFQGIFPAERFNVATVTQGGPMPTIPVTGHIMCNDVPSQRALPGCEIVFDETFQSLGLPARTYQNWPANFREAPASEWTDPDGDGFPGLTVTNVNSGAPGTNGLPTQAPPTASNPLPGQPRAGWVDLAYGFSAAARGTLEFNCADAWGPAYVANIVQRARQCYHADPPGEPTLPNRATLCSDAELEFIDSGLPRYTALAPNQTPPSQAASVSQVPSQGAFAGNIRFTDNPSCTELRSRLDARYPH